MLMGKLQKSLAVGAVVLFGRVTGSDIYNLKYTLYNISYTIYNIQYSIYNILHTIYFIGKDRDPHLETL